MDGAGLSRNELTNVYADMGAKAKSCPQTRKFKGNASEKNRKFPGGWKVRIHVWEKHIFRKIIILEFDTAASAAHEERENTHYKS